MSALALTGADLIRALRQLAAPAVGRAVRARAEAVARAVETERPDAVVRVMPRAPGGASVAVSAPGLFARGFGALDALPDPLNIGRERRQTRS